MILIAIGVMAAGAVACGTGLLVSRLHSSVKEMAEITVPDFITTEQLIQRLLENWSKVLLIQQSESPDERLNLIEEIKLNSTDASLKAFEKTPNSPEQKTHLYSLLNARSQFVQIRENYFAAVRIGDLVAAENILDHEMITAFDDYREQAVALYAVTAEIGQRRAERVVNASSWVVVVAGVLSIIAFAAGFLLGFRTLFRSLKWAHILANKSGQQAGG